MPITLTEKLPANLKELFGIVKGLGIDHQALFKIPTTPAKEKFVRKNAPVLTQHLTPSMRHTLTSVAKKLRNPAGNLRLNYPLDFPENRLIRDATQDGSMKPWWGKSAAVCITHDIDNAKGMSQVASFAKMNLRAGVKATFNFLTHAEYRLEKLLLHDLMTEGFEIGLHGFDHDQGYAFRPREAMLTKLKLALFALRDFNIGGYRSPALSLSETLFAAIGEMGLRYDSTLQIASPFYHSVRLPYPVYLAPYGLWELPLMVQDDSYLRDARCDEGTILNSLNRFIQETQALNGVFVLNVHPHNFAERAPLYREILELIRSADVAVVTMSEVVDYVEDHTDHK